MSQICCPTGLYVNENNELIASHPPMSNFVSVEQTSTHPGPRFFEYRGHYCDDFQLEIWGDYSHNVDENKFYLLRKTYKDARPKLEWWCFNDLPEWKADCYGSPNNIFKRIYYLCNKKRYNLNRITKKFFFSSFDHECFAESWPAPEVWYLQSIKDFKPNDVTR